MQKIARVAGRTNNIDQCATTCHAPTVAGLAMSFGSGAMTNAIDEIKDVQTLFLIGANPTEAHPIVGLEMKKALRRGARLVVCDPRTTWMAARADVHIKHRPGTAPADQPAIWLNTKIMAEHREPMRKFYYDPARYDTYLEQLGIKYPTVRRGDASPAKP